ncbi:RNA polymerase sigma factor for late transcription [Kosakonia phage Kc304]|uniref:RNA polymerase sigma-like factor n=2 Tax=Winklervirus chi14 TaxID=2560752 RepID=A0A1Z1LY50_9CAUD|nr:late sigma transcription factor [Serratia phage CHI14]ARW57485.1 sigma factor for late transcription [Serratia phage CHI14]ARW57760.1 sigma factor for late transcription [Serratia phage CBH8]QYN80504.1 RNA polymerase sigma factor for late transcription [Kosakonia phage Kc304]UJJ22044.1 RNA polymerase sigma factor [Erwinia phage Virsaitis27]
MANYVNNKELYQEICRWKKKCAENPDKLIPMTNEIGLAIMLISEGLSKRFNFSGYTQSWKQEMIEDGIEAAIKGLKNFDENKYNNPHAYITQACFNAFVQRIKKERREVAKKYSYFVHNVYDSRDDDMVALADETFIQDIYDKMTQYESSLVKVPGSDTKVLNLEDDNALDFLYEAQT